MRCALLCSLAMLASFSATVPAQTPAANTPPMGWNSWDAYGLTITEEQFRANVAVLKQKLLPFGWQYAVIDEGWFFENPQDRPHPEKLIYALDAHGRYVPTPLRFPSAGVQPEAKAESAADAPIKLRATIEETSFAKLGAWVHAQGLRFGIHIVRGVPRASVERGLPIEGSSFHAQDAADTVDACPWDPTNWGVKDNAAGQAWYDSLLRQYAGWGVDLLKVDCISDHPYKAAEIRMIRRAIDKAGRPMVLSLSPGPTALEHAAEVGQLATMWRISDDFWDTWGGVAGKNFPQALKGQFERLKQWSETAVPARHWPDADMLPFGELRPSPGWGAPRTTRLTLAEQRTVMTLWAMNQSPLILGANLTLLDEATLKMLTNKDVLRMDQAALGRGRIVGSAPEPNVRAWAVRVRGGGGYFAVFNLSDSPVTFGVALGSMGMDIHATPVSMVDLWTGATVGSSSVIAPHGCVLLASRPR